jgi:xylose isomerase
VFGHGDTKSAFFLVDLLESSGWAGPRHFDYKPGRTEDADDVWVSAEANMRTYLILKERAKAYRADPEVKEAMQACRIDELAVPTVAAGESYQSVREEECDLEAVRARGYHYSRLNQLALEHMLGNR